MNLFFSAITISSVSYAGAATIDEIKNIQKTKNPIAALMLADHKCNLIAPPSAYMMTSTKPGAGGPGGLFIPKFEKDGMTYNFDTAGRMCPLPKASNDFPIPLKDSTTGRTSSMGYRNEITASLKLTLGSWLKLVDFDATNIEQVGIWITTDDSPAFEPDQNRSVREIRQAYKSDCSASSDKALFSKVKIIDRACVGKITISLVSKNDMALNAFNIEFSKLTVGVKATWKRDIVGASSSCKVDASGMPVDGSSNAGVKPDGDSKPATGDKPAAGAAGSSSGTSFTASITDGNIDAAFKGPIENFMTAPTKKQVESVTPKKEEPKPAEAMKTSSTTSDKPAQEKPVAEKAATKDAVCAKNVIYQTDGMMVLGVHAIDAKKLLEKPSNQ